MGDKIEGCQCEGFYKKEYFDALKTIQSLREELHDNEKSWEETCKIMFDKVVMEQIQISLQQIRDGKGIPLSELDAEVLEGETDE